MNDMFKNLVEKSNILNTLRCPDMNLTELRFFCLYLSRLNAREPNRRAINIPLEDFEKMFDVKINTTSFRQNIKKILNRTAEIKENGDITEINLYSKFKWHEEECKYIEVTCNSDVIPYLFELQKSYTKYMIGNISKLTSVSKIRLYEIAKQYEYLGSVKLSLDELQDMICSQVNTKFPFFNRDTLKPAIADINKYTDINISYEKILKCRKVVALNLIIKRKDDKIAIEEKVPVSVPEQTTKQVQYSDELINLNFKLNEKYTLEQLQNLYDIVTSSNILQANKLTAFNYIVNVYSRIKASGIEVKNLYKYTLGVISNDVEHSDKNNRLQEVQDTKPKKSTSYDLEEYKDFIRTTKRKII